MGFSGSVPFKFEHKGPRNTTASKIGYGVILLYDNADVIETLVITSFHLYLIQLLWSLFQIFVNGSVVYAETVQVLTLKNPIEPP